MGYTSQKALLGDLKRAIVSGRFLLGVALGLLMLYQPAYPFGFFEGAQFQGNTLTGAIQDTFGLGIYTMCCSVLCTLPYADAHAWEVTSGEYPYILTRVGTRPYVFSKIIATAISGGLVLCTSLLIFCLVQAFLFVPSRVGLEEWRTVCFEALALLGYGACWSLCGLGLSAWLANPYVVLAMPFFVTRFLWLISSIMDWDALNPSTTIGLISTVSGGVPERIAAQQLCFSFLFVMLFGLGVKRKKC